MKDTANMIHRFGGRFSKLGLAVAVTFGSNVLVLGNPTSAMACSPDSYIGTVCAFSFNWCPAGWLQANGQAVSINSNQALYSLISTQYGGSIQSGTFNLPDLRGRAVISQGQGAGLPNQVFASPSGVPSVTLSMNNLPAHNHSATFAGTGGGTQTVNVPAATGTLGVTAKLQAKDDLGTPTPITGSYLGKGPSSGSGGANIYVSPTSQATAVDLGGLNVQLTGAPGNGPISFNYQSGITGGNVTIGSTGNSQPFSTQSPSLTMNYCIMVNGIYPDRP